ncbi:hypothetical protein M405DRAFT_819393 [Rhizopogon salebrosus TDB-379]|nr:hypothetical protein M405DRAFT_819393 [Rhizopogon salebrosus TDB-379]
MAGAVDMQSQPAATVKKHTYAPSHALVSQEVLEHGRARECFSSPASCKCSDRYLMVRLRSRRKACCNMRVQGSCVGCAEVES